MLNTIRRSVCVAGAAALFLGVLGCGGANLGGSTNPYYGSYIGAYSESSSSGSGAGTFSSFTVDPSGNIAGTLITGNPSSTTATIQGTVANTTPPPATTTGTVSFPGGASNVAYTGNFTALGHGWLMTITVSTTPVQTYNIVLVP